MWDNYAVYKHAVEKGYKKGYEEGKKIGYEEGYKIEYEEGIAKGEKKASKEFALKLLAHNFPIDEIADITDLSIEEIKKLEQYI